MSDAGKIIHVERKYGIYTDFLDTVLQTEDVIREGETREQAMNRIMDELDKIAHNRKRQAHPHLYQEEQPVELTYTIAGRPPMTYAPPNSTPQVIDYKKFEELEIAIDNATSLEELDKIKSDNPIFPAKLLNVFNAKRKELSQ